MLISFRFALVLVEFPTVYTSLNFFEEILCGIFPVLIASYHCTTTLNEWGTLLCIKIFASFLMSLSRKSSAILSFHIGSLSLFFLAPHMNTTMTVMIFKSILPIILDNSTTLASSHFLWARQRTQVITSISLLFLTYSMEKWNRNSVQAFLKY